MITTYEKTTKHGKGTVQLTGGFLECRATATHAKNGKRIWKRTFTGIQAHYNACRALDLRLSPKA